MTSPQTNSLGYIIPCQKPIELGNNAVTYCTLAAGHEGGCVPQRVAGDIEGLEKWWREHTKCKQSATTWVMLRNLKVDNVNRS